MKADFYRDQGFQEVIAGVLRDFRISEEKNVISFYCYFLRDSGKVATNIIRADVKSKSRKYRAKLTGLTNCILKL